MDTLDLRALIDEADSPLTPEARLVLLASDENELVRVHVAINIRTPTEALAHLAEDTADNVRWRVAANPSTPPEVLSYLARDENPYVRGQVAANPSTPFTVLACLVGDEDTEIEEYVAKVLNRHPTTDLVELLKVDFPEASTDMPRDWLLELLSVSV